jgi:hypothetical protein
MKRAFFGAVALAIGAAPAVAQQSPELPAKTGQPAPYF